MIVIDASVLAPALGDDGPDGDRCRRRLWGESLLAPELIDLEVTSVLRTLTNRGELPQRRADLAVHDLAQLPLRRAPHRPLLGRIWELGANLTPYDAAYVALAELVEAPLLTADRRLAASPGPACAFELVD